MSLQQELEKATKSGVPSLITIMNQQLAIFTYLDARQAWFCLSKLCDNHHGGNLGNKLLLITKHLETLKLFLRKTEDLIAQEPYSEKNLKAILHITNSIRSMGIYDEMIFNTIITYIRNYILTGPKFNYMCECHLVGIFENLLRSNYHSSLLSETVLNNFRKKPQGSIQHMGNTAAFRSNYIRSWAKINTISFWLGLMGQAASTKSYRTAMLTSLMSRNAVAFLKDSTCMAATLNPRHELHSAINYFESSLALLCALEPLNTKGYPERFGLKMLNKEPQEKSPSNAEQVIRDCIPRLFRTSCSITTNTHVKITPYYSYEIDIVLKKHSSSTQLQRLYGIEIDGPSHFIFNLKEETISYNLDTQLKQRVIAKTQGDDVIVLNLPYIVPPTLRDNIKKYEEYKKITGNEIAKLLDNKITPETTRALFKENFSFAQLRD